MYIGKKKICNNGKPYFIADIAANHDGNLQRAYKLIELAKESGADAAKFQNFKAGKIVSRNGFNIIGQLSHQAGWKKTVYEVYEDASLQDSWTPLLKKKCDEVGIEYMTSPYDFQSVDWAEQYVNAYKIGSGDITWTRMLEYIAQKGKPVIIATGASDIEDVKRAMGIIQKYTDDIVLMQCNTNYTADRKNFSSINLNVLKLYSSLYPGCLLGLSDHTYGHTTVLGAMALGARVFEKHFTDDNGREGPDHKFAMNPGAWKEMVKAAYELYDSLGDGIKKIEDNEKDSVVVQQRAVYMTKNLKAGSYISEEDIFPLRPLKEGCVYPYDMDKVIGMRLKCDIYADDCLKWEMLEFD